MAMLMMLALMRMAPVQEQQLRLRQLHRRRLLQRPHQQLLRRQRQIQRRLAVR